MLSALLLTGERQAGMRFLLSERKIFAWGVDKILWYCTTIMVLLQPRWGVLSGCDDWAGDVWRSYDKDCQTCQILEKVEPIAAPLGMRLACTPKYLHHKLRKNGAKFYQFC